MTLKSTNQKNAVFVLFPSWWKMNIDCALPLLLFLCTTKTDNIHNITYAYIRKTFSLTYKHSPCVICYHNHYRPVFLRCIRSLSQKKAEKIREKKREGKENLHVMQLELAFFGWTSVRYCCDRYQLTNNWTRFYINVSKTYWVREIKTDNHIFSFVYFFFFVLFDCLLWR